MREVSDSMSINVKDFRWEKGVNDIKYIELLEKELSKKQSIINKAIAKLRKVAVSENSIPLDRIKQAREEIEQLKPNNPSFKWYKGETIAINKVLEILDKLIAESEE
jgi:hypothetical protein